MNTTINDHNFNAAILALNENRKAFNLITKNIIDQLTPYIGKKVFKQDGNFMKNIPYQKLEIPNQIINGFLVSTNFYHEVKYKSFRVIITTTVTGVPDQNNVNRVYQKQEIFSYIFDVVDNDTVLSNLSTNMCEYKEVKTEDVLNAANKVKVMKEAYEAAVSQVPTELRSFLQINHIR